MQLHSACAGTWITGKNVRYRSSSYIFIRYMTFIHIIGKSSNVIEGLNNIILKCLNGASVKSLPVRHYKSEQAMFEHKVRLM